MKEKGVLSAEKNRLEVSLDQEVRMVRDLQAQIEGTENRVTVALGDWNTAITDFNTKIIRFPSNLIAGMFGYTQKKNYEAAAGAEDTKVDFSK
jgi:LemA protein